MGVGRATEHIIEIPTVTEWSGRFVLQCRMAVCVYLETYYYLQFLPWLCVASIKMS